MRTTIKAAVLVLVLVSPSRMLAGEADILIGDFESATYGDWIVTGEAFGPGPAAGALDGQMQVSGFLGDHLVNSFYRGDATTGTLTSPEFLLSRRYLCFLIGGGRHPDQTCVELLVDDEVVHTATGDDSEELDWHSFDVGAQSGKQARIRIADRHTGGWGHVNVDHILLSDTPRLGKRPPDLAVYRESPTYYREPHRPQIHFTPELNWMNDPNGMVFFDGEYHLFYQHNPFGIRWGHMSWGHAVSRDLVHWEHLPLALAEEDGVMIFSGSAVVDWKNSSGLASDFKKGDTPPLVAIYTGHTRTNQSQHIAYSTDRGRSWTKYSKNPVLDIGKKDFRDPKVFWHEATKRWVMAVTLPVDRKVQLYGSRDLKAWDLLSEFGPAGAVEGIWECPDLIRVPVEGSEDSRWVLIVNIGSGAVAGGSGCQYFVGDFDGTTFRADPAGGPTRWADHGKDFYAAVSWADVPRRDGRTLWIGWMSNWQYANDVPTTPWRSAMTVPRELTLREVSGDWRLVQRPVRELESSRRGKPEAFAATGAVGARLDSLGTHYELEGEFEVGEDAVFSLAFCEGPGESTTATFDIAKGRLTLDRQRSGTIDFNARFPSRSEAPITTVAGRVRVLALVDASSIELFINGGQRVMTTVVLPGPRSTGFSYRPERGVLASKIRAWKLDSIWR